MFQRSSLYQPIPNQTYACGGVYSKGIAQNLKSSISRLVSETLRKWAELRELQAETFICVKGKFFLCMSNMYKIVSCLQIDSLHNILCIRISRCACVYCKFKIAGSLLKLNSSLLSCSFKNTYISHRLPPLYFR